MKAAFFIAWCTAFFGISKRIMSGTPEQDWAAIKRAWAEDKLTPKEIAAAYGLSYQKLSARARAEGWRKGESGREGNAEKQRPASTPGLMKRLRQLLERQIEEIENTESEEGGAAARERDARTLSSLIRTMEKLLEMQREREARRRARNEERGEDAELLRGELARRLARLARSADAGNVSGEPDEKGSGVSSA